MTFFVVKKLFQLIGLFAAISFYYSCTPRPEQAPPNILFIAVDDLRPELNCYGSSQIKSPNIDKVADGGIIFKQAYCQVPVCGASRASLLTGIRPNVSRFLDYDTWADEDAPGALSLPNHFKNNGYYTLSRGKIFHHKKDKLESWSEEPWLPLDDEEGPKYWRNYQLKENIGIMEANEGSGPAYEKADVDDNAYFDGQIADRCIQDLRRLKDMDKPFFLAAGFLKPHLPFNAPSEYWDMYDPERIKLPDNPFRPEHAPDASMHNFGELRAYTNIPGNGPLSDSLTKRLIHGYFACVSYTDSQIGKLLLELKVLELDKNTVVIIWGDHGWNLGEHGLWCKHCNYETSLRAPVILKVPWLEGGLQTDALIEFVDIYPTLCELAGLNIPDHVQGESLLKYMDNPSLPGKPFVFSRWQKGESVKNVDYRYTEWIDTTGTRFAEMLYDHQTDYDENHNISGEEEHTDIIRLFREKNLENRRVSRQDINNLNE
jgi:arylsulfatase A-like enzyme